MKKAAAPKARRQLAKFGRRGEWVRVFLETGHELVRVQWKLKGRPGVAGTESWPNTKEGRAEAEAYARGKWDTMSRGGVVQAAELTLLELWQKFAEDQAPHLRPRTLELYEENYRYWLTVFGEYFLVDRTTVRMPGEFRRALEKRGLALRTIRNALGTVKTVYRWAEAHELITANKIAGYRFKVAKEQRPQPVPEYRRDAFELIHRQLDPAKATQWRAWVALALCAVQGARQNAVLHLRREDVTLGFFEPLPDGSVGWVHGEIRWRPEFDKTGKDWTQPLRLAAQMAIEVALEWHDRMSYTGEWLLPAGSTKNTGETYDKQSLWWALQKAEQRAGLEKVKGKAAHSLRRMLAGDVSQATGNFLLGLRAIGDKDVKRAAEYIQTRDDQMRSTFAALDGFDPTTGRIQNTQPTRNAATEVGAGAAGATTVSGATSGDTTND